MIFICCLRNNGAPVWTAGRWEEVWCREGQPYSVSLSPAEQTQGSKYPCGSGRERLRVRGQPLYCERRLSLSSQWKQSWYWYFCFYACYRLSLRHGNMQPAGFSLPQNSHIYFLCLCYSPANKTKVHVPNTHFWLTCSYLTTTMKMGDTVQQMPPRIFNPNPLIKVFSS